MEALTRQVRKGLYHMPTSILLTKKMHVTALINIETPDFLTCYRNGLRWSLYGDWERSSPLPDTYLIDNLKQSAYKGFFDRQNDERLPWIGFYFGMMHGGILSPDTGALRADVCTLASLTHRDSKRGYEIGRRDCSMNYASDQRISTEGELLEEVRQIALDVMGSPDEPDSWYYSIGCMLGNMSLQVFTATAHEYAQWEAQYRQWEKEYELDIAHQCDTEPLDAVPVVEYTS